MIVVTGAAGFIGSVLVGKLQNDGFSDLIVVDEFSNPEKLIAWIASQKDRIQLRADHKLIIKQDLTNISKRADFLKAKLLQIEALKV